MSGYPFSRHEFLALAAAQGAARGERLGWRAIVDRHKPALREVDPRSPLTVGNGEFAFTADESWGGRTTGSTVQIVRKAMRGCAACPKF